MVRDYGARYCKQEHVVVARDANSDQRLAVCSCPHPHSCLPDACIDHCFCFVKWIGYSIIIPVIIFLVISDQLVISACISNDDYAIKQHSDNAKCTMLTDVSGMMSTTHSLTCANKFRRVRFRKRHFSDSGRTSRSTYAGTCVMSPLLTSLLLTGLWLGLVLVLLTMWRMTMAMANA